MMQDKIKSIVILGCFDTKGAVFAYLRQCIVDNGESAITINTGVMGSTNLFEVDFESDLVTKEAGFTIEGLRKEADRGKAVDVMGRGASKIVAKLVAEGRIKGIIGMGGGGGTFIAISSMQEVP